MVKVVSVLGGRFDLDCVKLIIVDIAKSLPIAFHDFSIPFW